MGRFKVGTIFHEVSTKNDWRIEKFNGREYTLAVVGKEHNKVPATEKNIDGWLANGTIKLTKPTVKLPEELFSL